MAEPHHRAPALFLLLVAPALAPRASAQEPLRGPRHGDPRWHALVHARVVAAPGETLEDATVELRDGRIVAVAAGAPAPEGARVHDLTGLTVYAGFVEPWLPVAAPRGAAAHWSPRVSPERSALDGDGVGPKDREALRALGFAAACAVPEDGVLRGTSALVALGEPASELEAESLQVLARGLHQVAAFETSGWNERGASTYPTSEMGAIALLRQTLSDAEWYAAALGSGAPPEPHPALAALGSVAAGDALPLYFAARDELQVLRAAGLAREAGRALLVRASGTELRRLPAIAALGLPLVVPLDFPEAPRVGTPAEADRVSLRELMTWEQAPANPARLAAAGVALALTSDGLEERADFRERLARAIRHGLAPDAALAALTTEPARLLGQAERLGRVAPGFLANLVVCAGDVLDPEQEIRAVWVLGRRHEVKAAPGPDLEGSWSGAVARLGERRDVPVELEIGAKKVLLRAGEQEAVARAVERRGAELSFRVDGAALGASGVLVFSGRAEGSALYGALAQPDGELARLAAERVDRSDEPDDGATAENGAEDEDEDEEPETAADVPAELALPFGAFGLRELPPQQTLLLAHATVWTSGPAGVIEDGAVLLRGGRIEFVGRTADAPRLPEVVALDLAGKHVTPGLIDCHSHTGISGQVNEMGRRVTCEVRVADVIDPDDVAWYRELAGGLTAANQLHGSGNAIGGQNSVVKLRWGAAAPDDMRFEGAPPGVKLALGENPKRVAAGTGVPDEYPQTRMGVAALIEDRIRAGAEYRARRERWAGLSANERAGEAPPRMDLELEALAEIAAGERLVHCHSYRQDEILMLCELRRALGFRIGTFQHVLEGYKVAEAIADAGAGASTFSDWWAYKFEVVDAIPHNAALMHDAGVLVSINSDSDEHARRLNTEAAKAVKYGGLAPAAALELVTINPARQLGVGDRTGSLEVGKDADVVVWTGSPLSYRSLAERTFVDGRELFSLTRHRELLGEAERERARIVQKLLAAGAKERGGRGGDGRGGGRRGAEDDEPDPETLAELRLRAGLPPEPGCPGECGVGIETLLEITEVR